MNIKIDPPASAAGNMRADEELFTAAENAQYSPVSLRFYSWQAPAITYGYAQNPEKLGINEKAEKLGIQTAGRITGGGLVFHQPNELTYCLTAPLAVLPQGLLPSCNFISEIFIKALKKIGINAELAARSRFDGGYARDICFARPAKYEVVVNGKKLIGSAQKRGRRALLQHGSLPLEPPLAVFAEFADLAKLKRSAENIQERLGEKYDYKNIAEIIAAEFSVLSL
ncbi:MAG: hypothetical protein LBD99_04160 [Candidatus Margulisbacteria bacterium]|jgi:lipoate-protein ligase A|nr:hypothetical protein [Candidatus Margulisiibacteriota bacterium]